MSAERHGITLEKLTAMLLEDRSMARDTLKANAAVQAVMGLAKLHGLLIDKQEVTGKDGAPLVPVLNVNVTRDQS